MTRGELETLATGGEPEAADYLRRCVERIVARDGELNAFIGFDPGRAEGNFAARSGSGLLSGVPVAVKDNIVTTCAPTTCGSRILQQFVSPVDATVVSRIRSAGGYVLGKTNLDEFAMGSSTEHSVFGVTRNPWDATRVAGGSSGGSAAAVASGMVPVALGSETGGSVRQPAAFCGVSGLKPTFGRVSRSGLVAFASSIDQVGVFGRTADDCERLFLSIAGHDPADSTSLEQPVTGSAELPEGVEQLRIGVVREMIDQLSGGSRANFDASVAFLRAGGATVEEISLPLVRHAIAIYYIVANAEASANLARFDGVRYGYRAPGAKNLQELYGASRSKGFGAEVKRRILLGTFALSSGYYDAYYGKAQTIRGMMRNEFVEALARFDLLLAPTTPSAAFRIGEKASDPLAMYLSDVFTAPANLAGIPALAVPSGLSPEGLPLSIQFMAGDCGEALLFRAARYFEQAPGWTEVERARRDLA